MDRDPVADHRDVTAPRGRNPWDVSDVRTFGRPSSEVRTELAERARDCIEQMSGATDSVRAGATRLLAQWNNQIGRASCRERVCKKVEISVVDVSLTKKHNIEDTVKQT